MREWIILVITPWRDIIVANRRRWRVSHRTGRISSFADMEGLVESNCTARCSGNAAKDSCIARLKARILQP